MKNENKNIIIVYNGWISVAKEDLKIQSIELDGTMLDIDTSDFSTDKIVKMLASGQAVMKSFGETYLNDVIDGGDNFSFDIDED